MKRIHLALVGLLVLQLALAAFVYWPRSAGGVSAEPLFQGLAARRRCPLSLP